MERTPGIRPRPSLWRQLDAAARFSVPTASTILLMLLTAGPFELPGQAQLLPAVVLGCVWFWSLFRPNAMPPSLVFLLGLFADLLGYQPIGVAVLTVLIVHGVALRWRRALAQQGFLLVWLVFAALAALAASLSWALCSLLLFRLLPPSAAVFQFILAAALYPGLATLLTVAHRTLDQSRLR